MNEVYRKWVKRVARILAVVWAGWWVLFGLFSGISEGLSPVETLINTAVPGLIFLAIVLIAWKWQDLGGVLLLLAGMFVLVLYPILTYARLSPGSVLAVLATMALPPIVAGVLCLACWRSALLHNG